MISIYLIYPFFSWQVECDINLMFFWPARTEEDYENCIWPLRQLLPYLYHPCKWNGISIFMQIRVVNVFKVESILWVLTIITETKYKFTFNVINLVLYLKSQTFCKISLQMFFAINLGVTEVVRNPTRISPSTSSLLNLTITKKTNFI